MRAVMLDDIYNLKYNEHDLKIDSTMASHAHRDKKITVSQKWNSRPYEGYKHILYLCVILLTGFEYPYEYFLASLGAPMRAVMLDDIYNLKYNEHDLKIEQHHGFSCP